MFAAISLELFKEYGLAAYRTNLYRAISLIEMVWLADFRIGTL
jgi:hypothetical protein